eukprot:5890635-Amphidinium_carterae.1
MSRPTAIHRMREFYHGTALSTVRALSARVSRAWGKNERWSNRAVGAIALVSKAAGPACSAAFAKLL